MPVTNPTPLPNCAFSKNELDLVLYSNDYLAAAAANAVNFLQFTGAVASGASLPLSWGEAAATMTCATTPDNSGLQFPPGDGSNTYVASLVSYFQANYFIDRDFVVSTDFTGAHPKLVFTAINPGPQYNFTGTIGGLAGVTTPGVTNQPITGFLHHVQLWVGRADGSGFDLAFSANIPLDEPLTGYTTVDLREELHAFLTADYPILTAAYAICSNSVRPYFVKYAQFFGTTPAPFVHAISKITGLYIVKGGLSHANSLLRNIFTELTVTGHPEQNRFMRQGSVNKLITKEQPEWLSYINLSGSGQSVNLVITIWNSDATSFSFNAVSALSISAYQKVQFQTGYNQLSIDTRQTGKTPVYYTVQAQQAGSPLTQAYAYVVDTQYRPWPRYFVYENAYGAFQTIGTVGKGMVEYDRTKDDVQMAVSQNTATIDGDFLECNILIQQKGSVSVGYDRSGQRNNVLLRDFMLSRTKYIWQNGALVPIGINSSNIKDPADGVYLYANTFEYFTLYQEEVYTEPAGQIDDAIADLINDGAGPITLRAAEGDYFYVNAGDLGIGADGSGNFKFTDPLGRILGRTGYTVYATQLPGVILPPNITYNPIDGSFTVLIPSFALVPGYPLIVFTRNIDVL